MMDMFDMMWAGLTLAMLTAIAAVALIEHIA